MRILEISNTFGVGGTEKSMQVFSKYLEKDKHTIFICGFFNGGERLQELKKHAQKVFIAYGDPDIVIQFIKENKIDVLQWHGIPKGKGSMSKVLQILKYCKEKRIRIIATSPFSVVSTSDKELEEYIDMTLFVSQAGLLKYLWTRRKDTISKNKYNFIYNPIDLEELSIHQLSSSQKQKLRKKYGISQSDFVIGKVVRNTLWKWDDRIIDILPGLIKKIPTIKVVIRAVPEYKKKLIQKKGLDSYVICLDQTVTEKQVMETYQLMDVHVHTCRIGESFGVVFAEAMFFGLPIVTDSTDFRQFTLFGRDNAQVEIVKNGINGFIEMSTDGFINRIYELYTNKKLYAAISEENKRTVKHLYDAKLLTKRLEIFLEGKENKLHDKLLSMKMYSVLSKENSLFDLIKINSKAVYEKFYC